MNIGNNIRSIRLQRGLTQDGVASQCGLSKGMISKIENGHTLPAVATLARIAQALGVKVASLMGEQSDSPTLLTLNPFANSDNFLLTSKGYRMFNPIASSPNKLMQPIMITVKHDEHRRHDVTHTGEEYIYIIRGEMTFMVNNEIYLLREGDSLYFDSTQKHGIHNVPKEAHYLDIFVGQNFSEAKLH